MNSSAIVSSPDNGINIKSPEEGITQIISSFDGHNDTSLSEEVLKAASNYQPPDCSNYFNLSEPFKPTPKFNEIENNNLALLILIGVLDQLHIEPTTNSSPSPTHSLKELFAKRFFNGHSNGSSNLNNFEASEGHNDYTSKDSSLGDIAYLTLNRNYKNNSDANYMFAFLKFLIEDSPLYLTLAEKGRKPDGQNRYFDLSVIWKFEKKTYKGFVGSYQTKDISFLLEGVRNEIAFNSLLFNPLLNLSSQYLHSLTSSKMMEIVGRQLSSEKNPTPPNKSLLYLVK